MVHGDRSSWPTLQGSADADFIFGICPVCHEKYEADMTALIEKHGAATKTRDMMDKAVWSSYGGRAPASLVPMASRQ
jgi:hypothetical protein